MGGSEGFRRAQASVLVNHFNDRTRKNGVLYSVFLRSARGRAQKTVHLWEGQVAQLVEHMTENHGVGGSIPSLATNLA